MTMAEVYLTEEDAVKLMFPKSERIRKELLIVPMDKKSVIESRIGWKFPEESFEVYIGETVGTIDGYAFVQNTIGKHKPMTYMVGVDAQGLVSNVELLVFREARGSEVEPSGSTSNMKANPSWIRCGSTRISSISAEPPCPCVQ